MDQNNNNNIQNLSSDAQIAVLNAQMEKLYDSLSGLLLAAGGALVSCTDPQSKEHFFLLGLNDNQNLCYFHGWNDDRIESVSFRTACIRTASREFAEESLEAIGSRQLVAEVIANHPNAYLQILPPDSLNAKCFWIHAGELGAHTRESILKNFAVKRKNPGLKNCQKEMNSLIWVSAKEFYNAFTQPQMTTQTRAKIQTSGGVLAVRTWLSGWFVGIFHPDQPHSNGKIFTDFCKNGSPCPFQPFLQI
eukprot:TRINITY_DN6621_c0_g1_i1.p1 TRINITY_DN6621_c0_g1~~TRINITY_DN6621_c0_g1_i1.p1  ORF type:complete len:258 (-),score=46.78 TRINITY_DN6621_c0_g1_i1:116-859(-)